LESVNIQPREELEEHLQPILIFGHGDFIKAEVVTAFCTKVKCPKMKGPMIRLKRSGMNPIKSLEYYA